jgi:hypothetical protein
MTNYKQQTAVDSIIEFCQKQMDNDSSIHKGVYLSIIKFCKEQITEESEIHWKTTLLMMTNNKQLSLIDALCILRTGYKTQQESELVDHAYLVIKQHSERLHLEYQRECIDEKLFKIKEDDKQQ